MFNILLDELPSEWNGYALNTDFRIGLQMTMASTDKSLSNEEKSIVAINLLFRDDFPKSGEEIAECVGWFMNGWSNDHHKSSGGSEVIDFDMDQGRIYSAFLSQYNIDLNIADMHFWRFMHLLTNLEECSFTRVIDIRSKKINSKMSKEERKMYLDAKRIYAISNEEEQSEEEKAEIEEVTNAFLEMIGKK